MLAACIALCPRGGTKVGQLRHRDSRPVDFTSARSIQALQAVPQVLMCVCGRGTLPYMAPEVVNDPQHVSEKADVWSLGMVLWELLTLEIPFAALSPQHIIHGLMLGNLQPPVRHLAS